MKNFKFASIVIGLSLICLFGIAPSRTIDENKASGDLVSTYLVLSPIGLYQDQEGQDYPQLFLENTIKFDAAVGSDLPDASKVSTIASSQGRFSSWVRYDGLGAPTKYDKVPNENGAILYANFTNSDISLKSLSLSGTATKLTYDLNSGENTFDPTGLTVTATYSDDSTSNVTGSVIWESLTIGMTSVEGSYSFGGVTKTITVTGITVNGETQLTRIYLNAGGLSLWDQAGAWFGAYCWNSNDENTWYTLNVDNSYYAADIDTETFTNVIFVRFANVATETSWVNSSTNIWNQTENLTFEGNCYTITGWNESDGIWSNI